eukprot:2187916-Prymnesium_polylepis.1
MTQLIKQVRHVISHVISRVAAGGRAQGSGRAPAQRARPLGPDRAAHQGSGAAQERQARLALHRRDGRDRA